MTKKLEKYSKHILLLLLIALLPVGGRAETTAADLLSKIKSKVTSSSSLSADFTMTIDGNSYKGTIKSKGTKFMITSSLSSVWYNGTDMWTYNPSTSETILTKPTSSELTEANPLLYVGNAANFSATKSKSKKAGEESILLIPKKKGTGVKSVTIFANSKTYVPTKITVTPTSGGALTITLHNVKLNANPADSEFTYPKSKYPKAKVLDMR